ncbi:MAG: nitroreductase, partial [Gammaproteobacteria bacterium]|nr:nitroreductase [Gammaproteobacteria bacterium]MYF51331.1 nitroreductase [Gammaproteobacteria bacterium]
MEPDHNPGFFDLVGNMRAMRRLKPDPVPEAMLRKVLDAGVKAP